MQEANPADHEDYSEATLRRALGRTCPFPYDAWANTVCTASV
jgi:hypothetical protein